MSSVNQAEFERCAIAAGLLTQTQLAEAHTALETAKKDENSGKNGTNAEPLAQQLIQNGLLNPWQASQLLEGQTRFTLGRYRIIDSLGRGGMGQVFLATIDDTDQKVAVKVLRRDRATPAAVEAFRREVVAHSELNHPNLVRALDAGFDGNVYYLVSEYVPGKNLRQLVRQEGPLPQDQAARIIAQAAAGLHHAHQNGWIHRDVKPGNILVSPNGDVKLADLGLAGPLSNGDSEQVDPCYNVISGTADYLCPDQVRSKREPTPAWDVYSLGCTLYYAVTGKVPFPGGTTVQKTKAHCEQMPIDPRRIIDGLSDKFVETLILMIAKEPQNRLPNAQAVIDHLQPFFTTGNRLDSEQKQPNPTRSSTPALEVEDLSQITPAKTEPKTSPIVPLFVLVVLPIVVVMLLAVLHFLLS